MSESLTPCPDRIATDFSRPAFCLFGLAFDQLTMEEVLDLSANAFRHRKRIVLSTPNVNHAVAVQSDAAFRDAVVRSDLVLVDGMPLVWVARLMGIKMRRLAGSSFFERLTEGAAGVVRTFFFGGPEGMAELASRKLNHGGGAVLGVGGHYPGFGTLDEMTSQKVAAEINATNPDFVVVALGAVKGQAWIEQIQPHLTAPMISHLGAVVNFVAGSVRRAPWILQASGMEWIWRIREEPRLWRRYYEDAQGFARLLACSTLPLVVRRLFGRWTPQGPLAALELRREPDDVGVRLTMSGDWRQSDMARLSEALAEATASPVPVIVDASSLAWVDQAVVAQLLRLRGHQARHGQPLRFDRPSATFVNALRLHCASYLL